jgi:hypothetical protein
LYEREPKFISVLHQVVIAVCGAVIAFSVSPDKNREYRATLQELRVLNAVQNQLSDYERFVEEHIPTEEQASDRFPQALAKLGFAQLSKDFFIPRPVYIKTPGVGMIGSAGLSVKEFLQWLGSDTGGNLFVRYDPSTLSLRNQNAALEQAKTIPPACLPTHLAVEAGGFPYSREPQVVLGPPTADINPVYLSYRTSQQDSFCNFSVELSVKTSAEPVRGTGGAAWLRSLKIAPQNFSHTMAMFDEIGSKRVDETVKFLEEKLNAPGEPLSFLGIKVQQETAAWIGPVITLMLVLFALAHLQHLRSVVCLSKKCEDYPWIGLFREPLAVALTYSSIVLLPSLANSFLILRSRLAGGATWHFGVVCVILIFVTGIFSGLEIYRIHKHGAAPTEPVGFNEQDESEGALTRPEV